MRHQSAGRHPPPVKLLVAMLSRHPELFSTAEGLLAESFGPVDYRSTILPFTHTDYYEQELGPDLLRAFIAFERLVDAARLAEIKLLSNEIERALALGERRRINLDPGYVCASKLVLASTKDHAHRVYLGQGIYAEVTLFYRDKKFQPWPWTYPDYASQEYIAIIEAIRTGYMRQLRDLTQRSG